MNIVEKINRLVAAYKCNAAPNALFLGPKEYAQLKDESLLAPYYLSRSSGPRYQNMTVYELKEDGIQVGIVNSLEIEASPAAKKESDVYLSEDGKRVFDYNGNLVGSVVARETSSPNTYVSDVFKLEVGDYIKFLDGSLHKITNACGRYYVYDNMSIVHKSALGNQFFIPSEQEIEAHLRANCPIKVGDKIIRTYCVDGLRVDNIIFKSPTNGVNTNSFSAEVNCKKDKYFLILRFGNGYYSIPYDDSVQKYVEPPQSVAPIPPVIPEIPKIEVGDYVCTLATKNIHKIIKVSDDLRRYIYVWYGSLYFHTAKNYNLLWRLATLEEIEKHLRGKCLVKVGDYVKHKDGKKIKINNMFLNKGKNVLQNRHTNHKGQDKYYILVNGYTDSGFVEQFPLSECVIVRKEKQSRTITEEVEVESPAMSL